MNTQKFTLSASHHALEASLNRLCEVVQGHVNSGIARSLRDLQQQSGLRVCIKHTVNPEEGRQLCPQEMLLLPEDVLRELIVVRGRGSDREMEDVIGSGVQGQIAALIGMLCEREAAAVARGMDALLEQAELSDRRAFPDEMDDILGEALHPDADKDGWGDGEEAWYTRDPLAVYCSRPTAMQTNDLMKEIDLRKVILDARPHVKYYALRLLWCAASLGQSLQSLTHVVQIHELAHLVTHLGLDASDQHWFSFHRESKAMVEGTAQELTHSLLDRRVRESKLIEYSKTRDISQRDQTCFMKLLRRQSHPYRVHLEWRRELPKTTMRQAYLMAYRVYGQDALLKQNLPRLF